MVYSVRNHSLGLTKNHNLNFKGVNGILCILSCQVSLVELQSGDTLSLLC